MISNSDIKQKFAALSEEDKLPYRLLVAIKEDDVEEGTELLVSYNIDVNFRSELFYIGHTLLTRAAFDSPGMCKVLLDRGADINLGESKYNATPLICAAERNTESCRILLEAGADPNMPDNGGSRPLHAAAQVHMSAIPLLLAAGADVHVRELQDIGGRQPLHYAAQNDPEACKLLLDAGADVNAPLDSEEAETAILVAASNAPKCCQVLIDAGANVNVAFNSTGCTPLHEVSHPGIDVSAAKALLKAGARTDVRDKLGITPLHFAAKGNAEVCQALLDAGADANITTDGPEPKQVGWTPLRIAASMAEQGVACAKILVDHGADLEAKLIGDNGMTPLFTAANGNPESLKILIKAGANINAQSDDGSTPLFTAAEKHISTSKILIEAGCALDTQDVKGLTALHTAAGDNHEICKMLLDAGAKFDIASLGGTLPLHSAALQSNAKSIQHLIDKGAVVDAVDNNGWTALHHAVLRSAECVGVLLLAGAKAEKKTDIGLSAHGLCMQIGKDVDVLATLVSGGRYGATEEKKRKREAGESGSTSSEDDD